MRDDNKLEIIVPISLELDNPSVDDIVNDILYQNEEYGITSFVLAGPCGGWRSVGYPKSEHFELLAHRFRDVKERIEGHGIRLGWWDTLTIKSGPSEYTRIVQDSGTPSPYASCPLDSAYRERFASDIARFARIAKPDFINFEDDYSISASSGCFCKLHLEEFARREGRAYTREELLSIFTKNDDQSRALEKRWKQLKRDTLVLLSEAVRKAVDVDNPEIPIGISQSGNADPDGDMTEAVCRALAGPRHRPFVRLYGVFYNGGESKDIPAHMYHALYNKEHLPEDFIIYHESDAFPHTRFFTAARQMGAFMDAAYAYGFDGSLFQTEQLVDDGLEDEALVWMAGVRKEYWNHLFRNTHRVPMNGNACCSSQDAKNKTCVPKSLGRNLGVSLPYDPDAYAYPLWNPVVTNFGIPVTTLDSSVVFLSAAFIKTLSDDDLLKYLSKGLFIDGSAAKEICSRGFSEYIGVTVGEDITSDAFLQSKDCPKDFTPVKDGHNTLRLDLGAREIIQPPFDQYNKGKNMPSAHMYAPTGNGKSLALTPCDTNCEIITKTFDFQGNFISNSMTRFVNKLGGHIVVMGVTLENNRSQNLYNYRRQGLIQNLLLWCDPDSVFAIDGSCIYTIARDFTNEPDCELLGSVTLINLNADLSDKIELHIPKSWTKASRIVRDMGFVDVNAYDNALSSQVFKTALPLSYLSSATFDFYK